MTKFLSTSALCLGIIGVAVVDTYAQSNLFVSNFGNNTVAGYDTTTGALAGIFAGGGINQPVGLAASNGSLYVTSYDSGASVSSIIRLSQDGSISPAVQSNTPPFGNMLANPKAIAFGANPNTLYVANGGAGSPVNNSYIGTANVNTGSYVQPSPTSTAGGFGGTGPLSGGYALAYDGSRYLYAGNSAAGTGSTANSIIRFDTTVSGDAGTVIALTPTGAGAGNILALNGLTIGPDGALYATDGTRGVVDRIATPQSNTSTLTIFAGNQAGTLFGPEGLAFAPGTQDLYVSYDDDTIRKFVATGPLTGFTGGVIDSSFTITEPTGAGPGFLAFSPIPEPSTYALFGVAGAAMLVFGLKRRQQLTLRA